MSTIAKALIKQWQNMVLVQMYFTLLSFFWKPCWYLIVPGFNYKKNFLIVPGIIKIFKINTKCATLLLNHKNSKNTIKHLDYDSQWLHGELARLSKLNKQNKETEQQMYSKMFWGSNPPSVSSSSSNNNKATPMSLSESVSLNKWQKLVALLSSLNSINFMHIIQSRLF